MHRLYEDRRCDRPCGGPPEEHMSDHVEPVEEALEGHDVTHALTPGQLLVAALALWLLLRILRGLRG
jgi:hypothetical protein